MRRLKVGIIGCGMIANAKHIPSLLSLNIPGAKIEVAALCGHNGDLLSARKTAMKFGLSNAHLYGDAQEMYEKEDLHTVHVCAPNAAHAELSIAALSRGIHVLCEKPMAINHIEAKRMVSAAQASGALLTIAYHNRFRPDVMLLKSMISAGEFGEIYYTAAKSIRRWNIPGWGRFLNRACQGGGALIDVGCHALDLALWLTGEYQFKSVQGAVFHKLQNRDASQPNPENWVEEAAVAQIVTNGGHVISLEASWALNTLDEGESQVSIHGTQGGADMRDGLRFNWNHNGVLSSTTAPIDTTQPGFFSGELRSSHVLEAEAFYNAVLGREALVVTPEQALAVNELIDMIYQSAEHGDAVEL